MKISLSQQKCNGNKICLGIRGNKEDIIQETNILFNFGAIDNDPIFLTDTFAYIYTDREQLKKGFIAKALYSLQSGKGSKRVIKSGKRVSNLLKLAEMKATEQLSNIPKEKIQFAATDTNNVYEFSSNGYLEEKEHYEILDEINDKDLAKNILTLTQKELP